MSIERDHHGKITFECDVCGDMFDSGIEDFHAAYVDAKSNGWKAIKVGDDWEHRCPDCVEED